MNLVDFSFSSLRWYSGDYLLFDEENGTRHHLEHDNLLFIKAMIQQGAFISIFFFLLHFYCKISMNPVFHCFFISLSFAGVFDNSTHNLLRTIAGKEKIYE